MLPTAPAGRGEAEDYLGSLDVTTDNHGQVLFDVPFTHRPTCPWSPPPPPTRRQHLGSLGRSSGDPGGAFSVLRAVANQPLAFAAKSGDGIAIRTPMPGHWTRSAPGALGLRGTLTLSSPAGLTGSGDGTGSLSYSGPLYSDRRGAPRHDLHPARGPPRPDHPHARCPVLRRAPLQTQFMITNGVNVVDTTADSGHGSLRQAILDANARAGLAITIDFAIPGAESRRSNPRHPFLRSRPPCGSTVPPSRALPARR